MDEEIPLKPLVDDARSDSIHHVTPKSKPNNKIILGGLVVFAGILVIVLTASWSGPEEIEPPLNTSLLGQLTKYELNSTTAMCNDGSPAVFYLRQNAESFKESPNWIIYLESGTACWSVDSCADQGVVSSLDLPETKVSEGFLSVNPDVNPYYYDYNVLSIPSCSSDYFTGTAMANSSDEYHFLGAYILNEILLHVLETSTLGQASKIIVAGQGSGGISALVAPDRIYKVFSSWGVYDTDVRVVVDTGWWLDMEPLNYYGCTWESPPSLCSLKDAVSLAYPVWNSSLPTRCTDTGLTWECFHGHLANVDRLPYPLFVFEWAYERAQLTSQLGIVGDPNILNEEEEEFMEAYRDFKQETFDVFDTHQGYFFPSCWSHEILTNTEPWFYTQINSTTLASAISQWDEHVAYDIVEPDINNYPDTCDSVDCNPTCPGFVG